MAHGHNCQTVNDEYIKKYKCAHWYNSYTHKVTQPCMLTCTQKMHTFIQTIRTHSYKTYMHSYKNTYTQIHTKIHTYVLTKTHTFIQNTYILMQNYTHTFVQQYMHSYTKIHAHI